MKRFWTCLKVLAAPLVFGLSMFILFACILGLSWLTDSFSLGGRIKYLIEIFVPQVKVLVWPVCVFCAMCLFKDEIVAVFCELKRLISKVRQVNAAGGTVIFATGQEGNGDDDEGFKGEAKKVMPKEPTVNIEKQIEEFCYEDAQECFQLKLQPHVSLAAREGRMEFSGLDARGGVIVAYELLRVRELGDVWTYMRKVGEFARRTKLTPERLSLVLYVVWREGCEKVLIDPLDMQKYGVSVRVKNLAENECRRH